VNGTVLKITALTPQLEMEIQDLLDETAIRTRPSDDRDLFAIFDADGKVLGIACAEQRRENCLIHFVVVRLESRGEGAGSALVNHALAYFAGRCDRAYVAAGDAGEYFERFGFRYVPEGELPESVVSAGLTPVRPGEGTIAEGVMMLDLPSRWTIP
jgi:N-acetylglutamate synthase-like GNAT family acetyltransferase